MSFKCSLFGHDFGEPDVKRERAEEGSEVVTTIREVAVCRRCGESRTVSENTEVTTLETPDARASEQPNTSEAAAETEPTPDGVDTEQPTADPIPDAESQHPADSVAQVNRETASDTETTDAETDDGVILDEDAETEPTSEERDPGQWPEESEGDEPDWVSESTPSPAERDASEVSRIDGTGSALTVPEGEFYCPECGFSTPVESSSLREGDFCPDCHRGSLDHQATPE